VVEQLDIAAGCCVIKQMQRIVRLAWSEIEAAVEPSVVCAVDVCALVEQPVERLAVVAEVSE
jgi:hypothetical protein